MPSVAPIPSGDGRVIRVFVAAPGDVNDARRALDEVIRELNNLWFKQAKVMLYPLNWKEHVAPWLDGPPEEVILRQIPVETWDLFIGVLWSRMGTPTGNTNPTSGEEYKSGTEEEFELAYRRRKGYGAPRMLLYRCTKPIKPDQIDARQLMLVQQFFEQFQQDGTKFGLYSKYKNLTEFKDLVRSHLETALFEHQTGAQERRSTSLDDDQRWLEAIGLSANPFQDWEAGQDRQLSRYVHDTLPYFQQLIAALRDHPRTMVVFGERGAGKSTMRKMVEHSSRTGLRRGEVLTINYLDFSLLADQWSSRQPITARDHMEQILAAGVQALAVAVAESQLHLTHAADPAQRQEAWKYIQAFSRYVSAPNIERLRSMLFGTGSAPEPLPLPPSPAEVFYGFCRAVSIFGIKTVNVLVDQLDEGELGDSPEAMAVLIAPLLRELRLMEAPDGLASFYFFLPAALEPLLKEKKVRFDRLLSIRPTWEDADLQQVIERRLSAFSRNRSQPFTRLAQLAVMIPDLDAVLIQRAQGNPRTLIKLCDYLIAQHLRDGFDEENIFLTLEDKASALNRLDDDQKDTPQLPSSSPPPPEPGALSEPAANEAVSEEQMQPASTLPAQTMPSDSEHPLVKPAQIEKSLDTPEDIVRVLPTPLAVSLARYLYEQDSGERVRRACSFAHIFLQFSTCVLFTLWQPYRKNDPELAERLRTLLFTPGSPPSMGTWRQAMERLLKALEPQDLPLREPFARFRATKEVWPNLHALVERRNDIAHERITVSDKHIQQELGERVTALMHGLSVFADLQLLHVTGFDVDDNNQLQYQVGVHQGNVMHPMHWNVQFERLYRRGRLVLHMPQVQGSVDLFPLMLYQQPEGQVTSQIYLYDRLVQSPRSETIQVQYVCPITQQSFLNVETIPDLRALNMLPGFSSNDEV